MLLGLAPTFTGKRVPFDPETWTAIVLATLGVGAVMFAIGLVARAVSKTERGSPPGSGWLVAGLCIMAMAGLMKLLA